MRLGEPFAGETVIGGEVVEAVPLLVDAVDEAVVGTAEFAAELKIVGRIGEDAIDRVRGQHPHVMDAVAAQDLVEGQVEALVGFVPHGAGRMSGGREL